jgi:FtsH-binding integral membrane protein
MSYISPPQAYANSDPTLVGKVLGLLAFSMVFTALGAMFGPALGIGVMLAVILSFVVLLVLLFARSLPAPARLGLLYLFCTLEGTVLGVIINAYVAAGMGSIVTMAAGTTAGLVFALSAYAWTTKRDLTGMRSYLFAGLVAVVIAGVIGFFVQAALFHLILASVTAILFSGYVLYDVQRLKLAHPGDDAVMLTIAIYLDILNLFLAILRILTYFMGGKD